MAKTNKDGVRATTAQLYPGRDTFEFDQGHVTKNQPITVLILLSESLYNNCICATLFHIWRKIIAVICSSVP